MSATPDWSGPLGQLVRRLDLDPCCTCFPPVRHDRGCRFAYRTDNKRCECRMDFSQRCSHVLRGGVPLSEEEFDRFLQAYDEHACRMPYPVWLDLLVEAKSCEGVSPASLFGLLMLFDPESHVGRPSPHAPAHALTHAARAKVMELRADRGLSPFHPLDGSVWEEEGQEVQVSVQGELGRAEGSLMTPCLTLLEKQLFESLEAEVMPACLLWPWSRTSKSQLIKAGHALREIKIRRLHRQANSSFAKYAMEAFGFQARDLEILFRAAGEESQSIPSRAV